MRDLSASVEQVVQRLAAEQLSAVVAAAAAVVEGGHCSPFELLYALGDVNTYTFPCGNEPETIINIKCQNTRCKAQNSCKIIGWFECLQTHNAQLLCVNDQFPVPFKLYFCDNFSSYFRITSTCMCQLSISMP